MAPQLKVPVSKPDDLNSAPRNHAWAKKSSDVTKLSSDLHVTVTADSHTNNVFKVNRKKKSLRTNSKAHCLLSMPICLL